MKKNMIYSVAVADRDFEEVNLIAALSTEGKLIQFIRECAEEFRATVVWDNFDEKLVFLCPNGDLEKAFVLFWDCVPLD